MNDDPPAALTAYLEWLAAYGDPDHEVLRTTAEEVQRAVAGRLPALADLPARAQAALDHGDVATAAALASELYRVSPSASDHRALLAAVASAVRDPAAIDPVAYGLALDGDRALRAGQVGLAVRSYRRAVAHAPWWRHARQNLAVLLESVGESFGQGYQAAWAGVL